MKKKSNIIFVVCVSFFLLIRTNSFSQQIIRSSLSSFGNTALENGVMYRQTVGQPSSASVLSNNGTFLRQGFQQPISSINVIASKECTLYMNPNPTSDFVTLEFSEEVGQYQVSIFDLTGKLQFREMNSSASYQIDIKKFPDGIYLLNVVSKSGYHCNEKLIILL